LGEGGSKKLKELMDTDKYHQGESKTCETNSCLLYKGKSTSPQSTQDQEYDEDDDPYCQGFEKEESTYDSDQDFQEHDDQHAIQDIPQEDEDDHG